MFNRAEGFRPKMHSQLPHSSYGKNNDMDPGAGSLIFDSQFTKPGNVFLYVYKTTKTSDNFSGSISQFPRSHL